MDVFYHKIEWDVYDKVVFTAAVDEQLGQEEFLLSKRRRAKFRARVGTIQINGGALGSFSLKEAAIGLGFRMVGTVGTGSRSQQRRVMCPHCVVIQKLKTEWQTCESCNKKFYLFDDNW